MRGLQMVNRRRTMKSKKTDNKKFAEKIICVCGRRFSYVGGLTYHKKVSNCHSQSYILKKKKIYFNFSLLSPKQSGNAAKA